MLPDAHSLEDDKEGAGALEVSEHGAHLLEVKRAEGFDHVLPESGRPRHSHTQSAIRRQLMARDALSANRLSPREHIHW